MKAKFSTKDSIGPDKARKINKNELIKSIKNGGYNRYLGGNEYFKTTIDVYKKGYIFKKQIILYYESVKECKEVERKISPLMEIFKPAN